MCVCDNPSMKLLILVLSTVTFFATVENAKILAVFPLPGHSHFLMFQRVMEELADKGHELDVYSAVPLKSPKKRYNDFSFKDLLPSFHDNLTVDVVEHNTPKMDKQFIIDLTTFNCETLFNSQLFRDLRDSKKKYDLFLTEIFGNDCMVAFGHHFKVPTVGFTTSVNLPWAANRMGNPDNPSYIPTYFSPYKAPMSFIERVWNTISLLESKYMHHFGATATGNKQVESFFGPNIPDLDTLVSNLSLLLVNSHFSIHQAMPMVPNFIEIGGVHIKDPKPLTDEKLKKLVEGDRPVIYLSMGSMIITESFPKEKIQALFDAFAELPCTVLWRATKNRFPEGITFPKNIHFVTWMPQLDILCHPNVKLFVSHGGLMGTQETIFCGTPTLGIPIFADQKLNIQQSEKAGYSIYVDFHNITKENVLSAAKKLLNDPSYLENAKTKSVLFRDRIKKPLETAIFWIEYVIRHKGALHLRSVAANLPIYQYYLLDVVCVLLGLPLLAIAIVVFVLRRLFASKPTQKTKKH